MNESKFEAAVKAAAYAPEASANLDAKIDRALSKGKASGHFRRRLFLSLSGVCAAGVWLMGLASLNAHASIHGIMIALDKAGTVCITISNIDAEGHQTPFSKSILAKNYSWYATAAGNREEVIMDGKSYWFDPKLKAYIVRNRAPMTNMRLSDLVAGNGGFKAGKTANIEEFSENGRKLLRASFNNDPLPERYVLIADAKTELPIRGEIYSKERGKWRQRQAISFAYGVDIKGPTPDLKKYRTLTPEAADSEFTSAMEKTTLASVKFKRGRLVVRDLAVAEDGTVFLAYQVGDKSPNSWSGYALNLKDDLGTPYIRVGQFGNSMEGPFNSPDGKVEMEVFTPPHPLEPKQPRTLTVTTQMDPDGKFTRVIEAGIQEKDGTVTYHWQPNYRNKIYGEATVVPVFSQSISKPTCALSPSWAETLNYMGYANDPATGISINGARGEAALKAHKWDDAIDGFQKELRSMQEHEEKGYGPWDQSRPMDKLDQARKHIVKPQ